MEAVLIEKIRKQELHSLVPRLALAVEVVTALTFYIPDLYGYADAAEDHKERLAMECYEDGASDGVVEAIQDAIQVLSANTQTIGEQELQSLATRLAMAVQVVNNMMVAGLKYV